MRATGTERFHSILHALHTITIITVVSFDTVSYGFNRRHRANGINSEEDIERRHSEAKKREAKAKADEE